MLAILNKVYMAGNFLPAMYRSITGILTTLCKMQLADLSKEVFIGIAP